MIIDLQANETISVSGGSFFSDLFKGLNNLVKPLVENGVVRDIGGGLEKIGGAITKVIDVEITVSTNSGGGNQADNVIKAKKTG